MTGNIVTRHGRRFAALLGLFAAGSVLAAPRFANVFGDHVVLQRDREIVIWGEGAGPEQSLSVHFAEEAVSATVGADGRWEVRLPALPASREGRTLELIAGDERISSLRDVVVGDVWLAAGQSNMQFPVRGMVKGLPEAGRWVAGADVPDVRFRRVNDKVKADARAEANDLGEAGSWLPMSKNSVAGFSALAAVFAREVHEQLEVPVGIIDVSWGGKPIEAFIPREAFATPLLRKIVELADADQLDELRQLHGGLIVRNPEGRPGSIFNARMAPLGRYGLRGFLWYQAESNAGRGEDPREYRHKMRAMIEGWRSRWRRGDLPCYYVQLPGFPPATGWVRVREEQRRALEIANTGMVVTIDVPGEGIHPPDKLTVGKRLARLALAETYGLGTADVSGPVYDGHRIEGREVRVQFSNCGTGLMVGNLASSGSVTESKSVGPGWFELAGADGVWRAAVARIEGAELVVTAKEIASPVAVRYACHPDPLGSNLYNRAGFPASPFCSALEWLPWLDQP
jgi:sialate O-acetylesterase